MTYEDETINQTNDDAKQKKKHSDSFASVTSLKNDIDTLRPFVSDNPKAVELILLLIERMDGTNSIVASRKTLSDLLGHSERTINRSIAYLKEKQIITTSRSGGSVVIHVNSKVSWKKGRGKFNFAKLNATVLLSESEQDQAESTK
ncbi:helix-turn-helix domain-containing protein [Burkholderia cepacia]|uniref:helix-turn-helix domain-containing protein n=1 Tax=Burkholderia cepacia TaxID=292 RepID=UPI001CF1AB1A|nr:helix-turn-helix domain-containing protein [Burkholderia cepacia]MCA8354233.1 helix-turn-helix domain-containing protein [Burkholderia cepacia]HDR9189371.1 hypothetical protein [Burkholderia vietnamiensis]